MIGIKVLGDVYKQRALPKMNDEIALVEQLQNLISKEKLDYSEVLKVASELSEFDENNVRFSVDANLVKRLGEQLVAKKTTALSELIKNSYDADASVVKVIFDDTDSPGGAITIIDNGCGMSKEALIKGFMRISTSDKEEEPTSHLYSRPRAGRKGIGRFSAQKMGNNLVIVTRTCKDEPFKIIKIDWEKFKSNSNLNAISSEITESYEDYGKETFNFFGFDKGTKLIISGTREAWTADNISTAFKYTSSVIKLVPNSLKSGITDPGFKPEFYIRSPIFSELSPIATDETEFLSEALALITATVTASKSVNVKIKGMKNFEIEESYNLPEIKSDALFESNFKMSVHYFPMERGSPGSHYLKSYLRDNGGVKLYRNGFFVPPYGARHDDWLGLDDSSRRRIILPPHSNTNFIGSIDITDKEGSLFEETSSREGLIENINFSELQRIGYQIIQSAVKRISSERGRKVTSSQKGYIAPEKTTEEKLQVSLEHLSSKINKLTKSENVDSTGTDNFFPDSELIVKATSEIQDTLEEGEKLIRELINEKNMFRVLASTGLAIAEFTHEVQLYLNNLMLNGRQLRRLVQSQTEALGFAEEMDSNINMLVSYTDFFTDTIRSNTQRLKHSLELRDVLRAFFDAMSPTIERRGYELKVEFQGDMFWTKPVHISELSSVLMNLFTNSCKAIVRAGCTKGKIKVTVMSLEDDHIIRFEDNGDGIPRKNWGKVFNPLYTTELSDAAYSLDVKQLRGMGLGLTITREIISNFGGEISVVEPADGYSTCLELIIPKASDSETPADAY